ncbi:hypothetical protein GTY54_48785 [Streptomyces sp. SID625]|nr:hypothetical protein [Streptomyces sp. SID625]
MARTMTQKVEQRLAQQAAPGERVLFGAPVFRTDGVRTTATGAAAGLGGAGGAAGVAAFTRRGPTAPPTVPVRIPGRVVVALTTRRLLVFSVTGAVVAGPGELLHSFPLEEIAWVGEPELVTGAAQALRVRIGIAGTGVLAYGHPRRRVAEGRLMTGRLIRELAARPRAREPGSGDGAASG